MIKSQVCILWELNHWDESIVLQTTSACTLAGETLLASNTDWLGNFATFLAVNPFDVAMGYTLCFVSHEPSGSQHECCCSGSIGEESRRVISSVTACLCALLTLLFTISFQVVRGGCAFPPDQGTQLSSSSCPTSKVVSRRRHWSSRTRRGQTWLPGTVGVLRPDEWDPPHCEGQQAGSRESKTRVQLQGLSKHCRDVGASPSLSINQGNHLKGLRAMDMCGDDYCSLSHLGQYHPLVPLIPNSLLWWSHTAPAKHDLYLW